MPSQTAPVRILGIDTPDNLVKQWANWLAPERQPFFLADNELNELPEIERGDRLANVRLEPTARDTYKSWGVDNELRIAWLDEPGFHALSKGTRAELVRAQHNHDRGAVPSVRAWRHLVPEARNQADGHRFVWWPSLLAGREADVLVPWIREDLLPSRHNEVPEATWRKAAGLLPNARRLAGTWSTGDSPNCFGTVMAAAGTPGAENDWVVREPFETFLAERTKPGGKDDQPGTVLVWRSPNGLVQHGAVTLGGGYVLQKQSQDWYTPREVLTVAETIKYMRTPGWRLSRRHLAA
jgi:hypothetical protein